MIEVPPEARDIDDLREGKYEDDEYVPKSEMDDVGRNKPELEPDWSKKVRNICAPERSVTKESNGFSDKESGEDNTSWVEYEVQSLQSTKQL